MYSLIFGVGFAVVGLLLGKHIDDKKSKDLNSGTGLADAPIVPVQSESEPPANSPDLDQPE